MSEQDRIKRFLQGQMTSAEAADFIDWLTSNKSEIDLDRLMQSGWDENLEHPDWNEKKLAQRVQIEIARRSKNNKKHNKQVYIDWRKLAASIIILFSVSAFWYFSDVPIQEDNIKASTHIITKKTEIGQKLTVTLPDGTKVKLNANSRIDYHEVFSDTLRLVNLKGEAFFEVKENPAQPFVVKTDHLEARVLGTSFNVKSAQTNQPEAISLMTGKLLVDNHKQQIFLKPGEKAVYQHTKNSLEKKNWDYKSDLAWIDGILYFDDNTFDQVLNKLTNWYGVQFSLQGQPETVKHYSAAFENESLENVLLNLSFSHKFEFEIDEKEVRITFKQ